MKIAVINFSGNVGKSTIARNLLAPRIPDSEVFAVETINSDGTEDETMKGKEFGDLLEALQLMDSAVVDLGASSYRPARDIPTGRTIVCGHSRLIGRVLNGEMPGPPRSFVHFD